VGATNPALRSTSRLASRNKVGEEIMDTIRLALAAAVIGLSGLGTSALAGKRDNSIRFATDYVLANVDSYFNNDPVGGIFADQVWDTLIYLDPRTGEFKGQLATAWKWIDDKTLEFELRKGVKFHNGAAFDADDVVYTVNFVVNPENKILAQAMVEWLDHAEKVDQYKVRIVTKQPFAPAIAETTNINIYPHEYYAKVGPAGMNRNPVGSGPFRVVEHALGKYIRMERNPDYFKDNPKPMPKVDKVEMRFIPDPQTQIAEMLAGGLDIVWNVARDQAEQLRGAPNLQVVASETGRFAYLLLNGSEKTPALPLRDIRVRRAIMHAIDREAIVKSILGEGARVLHTFCHPSYFGCSDEGAPRYPYDPAKAKQLLGDAGFPNGFDIDLYAYRDRAQTEAMIGYLRAVGIRANLRFVQLAALLEAARAGKAVMMHRTNNSGSFIQDVYGPTSGLFGGNPNDINHDGEVHALLNRGNTSLDPEVRKEAYARALALIQERAYGLPLYSLPTYYVAAKDLVFTPYQDELLRFWEMSWR
jgi:peptide/nickel transport system substrate-binding protein